MHEVAIVKVCSLLKKENIQPILFKGRAIAQYYDLPASRPTGDMDFYVRPELFSRSVEILREHSYPVLASQIQCGSASLTLEFAELPANICKVDLHASLEKFHVKSGSIFSNTIPSLKVRDTDVSVLSPEHHLRLITLHLLIHGGWRPIWLCDVAALLEGLPEEFDWELCLGPDGKIRQWILSVIILAHQLLGARLDRLPEKYQNGPLPNWLPDAVLKHWSKPFSFHQSRPSLFGLLRHPKHLSWQNLIAATRLPDPVRSTFRLNGELNNSPRLPYQLNHMTQSAWQALRRN